MKHTDIERLEKMGYDVKPFYNENVFIISPKKDPWDGVEFIRLDINGTVFRVKEVRNSKILVYSDIDGAFICKNDGTPSTESEYFEQLKKEAFERFGKINKGDKFDRSLFKEKNPIAVVYSGETFSYDKKDDTLWFGVVVIYQSGKWATRLPEKIKVVVGRFGVDSYPNGGEWIRIQFNLDLYGVHSMKNDIINQKYKTIDLAEFLAKQLEKYLNQKQE